MIRTSTHTPLMQQYHALKHEYQDTLLFFQIGDFYELFYEDAQRAAAYLGIALTARGKNNGEPIPLCGVPVHTKDHYIAKLIKGGFRIALCDQLEPAVPGIVVKRGVTQVFTPATLTDAHMLDEKKASYLFSCFPEHNGCGLLFGEILTGSIQATSLVQGQERIIYDEVSRFFPDEIIVPNSPLGKMHATRLRAQGYSAALLDKPDISDEVIYNWLTHRFSDATTREVSDNQFLVGSLKYFYAYMSRTYRSALDNFTDFSVYQPNQFLILDSATQRNLEIVRNAHDGSVHNTLYSVLDQTVTPMGSRLLRRWLIAPLIAHDSIVERHAMVAYGLDHYAQTDQLHLYIKEIGDLERIVGRIALGKAHLHDYIALKRALYCMPNIQKGLGGMPLTLAYTLYAQILDFSSLADLLHRALYDEGTRDWYIKQGYDTQLDTYRATVEQITTRLHSFELGEQKATGIGSLKVGYTSVHGYYIEITNTHKERVPLHYIRKQTLAGKERYVTPELQALESEINYAQSVILDYEKQVYEQVKKEVMRFVSPLRRCSHAIAMLDVLFSYAAIARDNRYVSPRMYVGSRDIQITEGRHPVVECSLEQRFIANDLVMSDDQSTWIITGPNMGGKSTFLRQSALIHIMAQAGSFVPATSAQLPVLDRIFTRIGAGDNVAEGKSTFLLEMEETATICTQATEHSLVILDEVGRGTSTYDGLAIAQAVVEYVHTVVRARCLFATHYHELVALEDTMSGVVSYHATSARTPSGIVFLYKMARGSADGSFGIEVARLAELPAPVISRARELLAQLDAHQPVLKKQIAPPENSMCMANNEKHEAMLQMLKKIDPDDLSPRQAHEFLCVLKKTIS